MARIAALSCSFLLLVLGSACGGQADDSTVNAERPSAALRSVATPDQVSPAVVCGPDTCAGCCDANGVCRGGGLPMFCGKGGVACDSCSVVDGERCGVCNGITACYFANDPRCF